MLQSCSKIGDFLGSDNQLLNGSYPNHTALWAPSFDIQESELKAGHLDVTDVTISYPEAEYHDTMEGDISNWQYFKQALNVVAWSEKDEGGKWFICLKVIYWKVTEAGHWVRYESLAHEISDPNVSLTYPTVSATYNVIWELDFMGNPTNISGESSLGVYLAYEKGREADPGKDIYYRHCDFPNIENYDFDVIDLGDEIPIIPGCIGSYSCSHLDILYYNFYGDTVNTELQMVTIAYECETETSCDLWIWNDYMNSSFCVLSHTKPTGGNGDFIRPEYPRIDAGLDASYKIDGYPCDVFGMVWHNRIISYDPWGLDYNWHCRLFDISDFPSFDLINIPYNPNNNPANIWDLFPYIDFDPLGSGLEATGGLEPYGHIVVTEGRTETNKLFKVIYTDTRRLQAEEATLNCYLPPYGASAGMATIAMYTRQNYQQHAYPPPLEPDFDIYFLRIDAYGNKEYYSRKICWDEPTTFYNINVIDFIDTAGEPFVYPKAPVGATFDYWSELVCWKFYDDSQEELHHIYGSYEQRPLDGSYYWPENQLPIAVFEYAPDEGYEPLTVVFENYSYDPDGWIIRIECDWGGTFQIIDDDPIPSVFYHVFEEYGEYDCMLTVVDNCEEKSSPWTCHVKVNPKE